MGLRFSALAEIDTPFGLPKSGTYTFTFFANKMAEGGFGQYRACVTIR